MLKPSGILTKTQLQFLDCFSSSPFTKTFILSGGTALCGFYSPYRYSEDLDFFSHDEFDIQPIIIWLKSYKKRLSFTSFDLQISFNRNLIFLKYQKEVLKTEFTYFPFPSKSRNKYLEIEVDSLEDITLNKLFTIYQNPRLRDYMDLYMILKKENFDFQKLRKDAKIKFDWDIDPIQLGSQLLKVSEKKDTPTLLGKFDYKDMENFYKKIAVSLRSEVFK